MYYRNDPESFNEDFTSKKSWSAPRFEPTTFRLSIFLLLLNVTATLPSFRWWPLSLLSSLFKLPEVDLETVANQQP